MGSRTPLYDAHVALGAKIVPFGGWDMPLHYGSQLDEHHAVRRHAGVFDVSHMQPVDVTGAAAKPYLQYLLANDVNKLQAPGRALYSCMLNEHAGVVDDLICYYLEPGRYRPVVNAATADKDLAWMHDKASGFDVSIRRRDDLAMLAVQGPAARSLAEPLLPAAVRAAAMALTPFHAAEGDGWLIGRTGYTGEDGFEIMLPAAQAGMLWQGLLDAGVAPCGLGARDTLRLEAGMNLYGQDMDEATDPLAAGLGWTIAWQPPERNFLGRRALQARRDAPDLPHCVGLLLEGRGVLRAHQQVLLGDSPAGEVTSGGFAPTLERSIALARVTPAAAAAGHVAVDIRGKPIPARVVKPPFVRNGQPKLEL
jgi:aminomethyltransferase